VFFEARSTLALRYPSLQKLLVSALAEHQGQPPSGSYVVVYDNSINQCTQRLHYAADERASAIKDYQEMRLSLDDERFELLILNANSEAVIQVTHPRFFPEPL
jgi:hypothetical protein